MKRTKTERRKLTEGWIERQPFPAKRRIVYDAQERDLGLKFEPTGSRGFFWFHAVDGKPRWMTIGSHPAISLNDARVEAKKLTAKNEDWKKLNWTGADPFAPPAKPDAAPTLRELIEMYCEQHLPKKAQDPAKRAKKVRVQTKLWFGDWLDRPLDAIAPKEVYARHSKLGEKRPGSTRGGGHVSANRAMQLLGTLYEWARDHSLYRGENTVKLGIKKEDWFAESPRTRFLKPAELNRLVGALEKESPDLRDFVALALFTGQRTMEILTARWELIDLPKARWTIPKPRRKNKREHVVLLSKEALRILKDRERRANGDASPWVFPGRSPDEHRAGFGTPWKRLIRNAGLETSDPEMRVDKHSLRHTNISYLLMAGRSIPEAAAVSGHRSGDMVERYGHLLDATVRETVAAGERKREALMKQARKQLPAA